METIPAPPAPPVFKDRSTGLKVFGILQMFLGCLFALYIPLILFAMSMSARLAPNATTTRMMVPGMVVYGVLAVAFIWMGVGSFKARRWARALMLIVSWSWLLLGLLMTVLYSILLPRIFQLAGGAQGMPTAARTVAITAAISVMGVFLVVIPAVLVWFYRRPDVKATCEQLDPLPGWTDACPLPVLGMSLWLWFGALSMLSMPLAGMSVLPMFGHLWSGLPAAMALGALAVLFAWAGWALYRLRRVGWWVVLVSLCFFAVSGLVTFSRVEPSEMYRLMGYSDQQLDLLKQYDFMKGRTVMLWSMATMIPLLAYLFFIHRYFRGTPSAATVASS